MKDLHQLAKKLIAIPSVYGNKTSLKGVLDLVKNELKGLQFKTFEKNGNPSLLFFNTSKYAEKFKIILNAHLDVVKGNTKQYKPEVEDGKLYGRGAYDMKAAAAAEILAYKNVLKKIKYPLALQLVTDEEEGGTDGTLYQIEQGVRAEFVIAGEPTDLGINNCAKGIIWVKITFKGKSSHSAYPWLGNNAIEQMNTFLLKLQKLFPVPTKEIWRSTVIPTRIISTNKTTNMIPSDCELYLDIRYIPEDKYNILNKIKRVLPGKSIIEIVTDDPTHYTHKDNFYIQKLAESIKTVLNKKAQIIPKHGGSDIRFYNQVGCEGITFSPIGSGHHTDNEWVNLKSLDDYYNILERFLLNLK